MSSVHGKCNGSTWKVGWLAGEEMYGSANHTLHSAASGPRIRVSPRSTKKDLMSFSFPALWACTSRYLMTDTCKHRNRWTMGHDAQHLAPLQKSCVAALAAGPILQPQEFMHCCKSTWECMVGPCRFSVLAGMGLP